MILENYEFETVSKYLTELIKAIYKESGITAICIINSEDKQSVASTDADEAPTNLMMALIRLLKDDVTDKALFHIIKAAKESLPNKDVEFINREEEIL